ncbi:Alcohol dehydrogenase GroES domain protein [Desulforamulus reducens MI-1]|uniref:Alcohol dehydrogenase GroES domain protein n=1 Tax=Desulforamulus reducens (strain ATCC BAA-1160 / DSM 100696 / MI-1) TaxID=349161 RepID=A4J9K3_DESRM|nr:zinc-dependent dehydrogenase [Desulforamulus reducens]ABO51756.1 Alcohol dehydrogenase GroES domain protein [Desulforamulus reducens MI-1]
MKAFLLEQANNLVLKTIEIPRCKAGEVLVKVAACGICRTDMKSYRLGHRDLHLPRILGHEIAGTVVEIGAGVTEVHCGERVQVSPGLPCGVCPNCLTGLNHLCPNIEIMGFHYDGGFAEYVLIPSKGVKAKVLNKLPDHFPIELAALTEPLACCINIQESMDIGSGDTIIIFGAGPVGILNAKLAKLRGAKNIAIFDVNKKRLHQAAGFAFCHLFNPLEQDPVKVVRELTDGTGAEAVIPCCPDIAAFRQGLSILRKRGKFGFFSGLVGEHAVSVGELNNFHYKEIRLFGAYGCSSEHNKKALLLLSSGMLEVDNLITKIIPLEDIKEGLRMVEKLAELKIVVKC